MEREYVLFSLAMLMLGFQAGEIMEVEGNSLDYTKEYKEKVFEIDVPAIYRHAGNGTLSKFVRSVSTKILGYDIFKDITLNFRYYTTHKSYSQIEF